jgi:hypothetical protein
VGEAGSGELEQVGEAGSGELEQVGEAGSGEREEECLQCIRVPTGNHTGVAAVAHTDTPEPRTTAGRQRT